MKTFQSDNCRGWVGGKLKGKLAAHSHSDLYPNQVDDVKNQKNEETCEKLNVLLCRVQQLVLLQHEK